MDRNISEPADWHLRCQLCKKSKGVHRAKDLACPVGHPSKIGYITFSEKDKFK